MTGHPTNPTCTPRRARGVVLAAALALLAMIGVASGLWPVAHQNLDHATAAQSHSPHDEPAPHSGETPRPLDHDCPVCDLIAGSQTLTITPLATTFDAALGAGPVRVYSQLQLIRQVDLTAWSARPPPSVG